MTQPFLRAQSPTYPNNLEAETAVLGSILISPHALDEVQSVIEPTDFYLPVNGEIYRAMTQVRALGMEPDVITLSDYLERAGALERCGGVAHLVSLGLIVPTSLNAAFYAQIVLERALERQALEKANALQDRVLGGERLADVVSETMVALRALLDRQVSPSYHRWDEVAQEYWDSLGELMAGAQRGLPTGYIDLDKLTGGMHRQELIVLGGRPSSGKSSFVLNIAHRVASAGHRVYLHSLEMSREICNRRLLTLESGIEFEKIRDGTLTPEEQDRLALAVERASDRQIYMDDSSGLTIGSIRSRLRRERPDLLIVDYLGFLKGEGEKRQNRVQELDEITIDLKELAKEMDIPVLVPSQLSREVEKRADHRPLSSDLSNSGAIEANADQIWLLYREFFYDPETLRPFVEDLEVSKHRNGHRGTVHFFVKDDLMKFLDLSSGSSPTTSQPELVPVSELAESMPF